MNPDVLISVYPTLGPTALLERRAVAPFPFNDPGLALTHLGRGAVWLALRALGLGPGSRLAMPAYHCGSEVEAARLAGITVNFYRVDRWLRVDEDDLARAAAESDASYVISHFGFPMARGLSGTPLIKDAAHGLFSADDDGPLGSGADAAIFCPRKSLGVPDGGAALMRSSGFSPQGRPPSRRIVRSLGSLLLGRAALARWSAVRRGGAAALTRMSRADSATRARRLTETVIGEWDLAEGDIEIAAAAPSRLTRWLLQRVDGDTIRARRRQNYGVLAAELGDACPEPFRDLPAGTCPLYFPLLVSDRPQAIASLLARGIRAVEIWPVPHPLLDRERFADLEPLRRDLLALPVHQDLEPWHMETVVRAAKEVVRS
ncbi:MAG: DegT/DnrJ/EryC1/StrS family aminotransferase [Actinomycetota bacterium]|nr:DegT/DnrJ/EryC1/StrS family aminotransferase [Actinomycetota bacterium]